MVDIKTTLFSCTIATCKVKAPVKTTYTTIGSSELTAWLSSKTIQLCSEDYYYPTAEGDLL